MAGLTARDAVVKPGAVVAADVMVTEIPRLPRGSVCAVFKDERRLSRDSYLGVVSSAEVNERPEGPVCNLLAARPPLVPETQPVVEVLKLLRGDGTDHLPVFDSSGGFIGVINQRSILESLLRRERELLRKTREFRQTSNDDKERRYETTRRLEQTNLAFRKLLSALSRPDSLESFKQALEALAVVADAGWAQLALCDESGKVTQRALASHPSAESHPPNYQAEQLMQQVLSENGLVNRSGTSPLPDELGGVSNPIRSKQVAFLGIPVAMDERRFGCVYLWDKLRGKGFVDDDEIMLASLGHAVALTLAHALDHARRKRLEAELDLLANIAREVGGAGSIDCIAEIVRERTEKHFHWDAFGISLSRAHGKKFQAILEIDKGLSEEWSDTWSEPYNYFGETESEGLGNTSSPQVNRRILSGEPVLINRQDMAAVELMKPFGDVTRPSASLIYVPIRGKKRVKGSLTIQSYKKNFFTLADMSFLQRIADAVAPAFRRCLAERTTHGFFDLAKKLSAASTPQQASRIIVEVADELIGWDACSMHFYYPDSDTYSQVMLIDTVEGERVEFQTDSAPSRPGGLARRTLQEGPILYLRPEGRFDKAQTHAFGDVNHPSASLLYVPLMFNEQKLGVLSIQSYEVNAYDQEDLDLLIALADQCSGAIERIRKSQVHDPVST